MITRIDDIRKRYLGQIQEGGYNIFMDYASSDVAYLLAEVDRLTKAADAKQHLVPCKACRGLGGITLKEHEMIERVKKLCHLNRYADADAALMELRHAFEDCAEIPYLESDVRMIDKGAVGMYYASGGTLGRYAASPPFLMPEGFVRPAVFHMTLLDIADSKILRPCMEFSSRQYEKWLDVLVQSGEWPDGVPVSVGIGYAEQGESAAYYEIWEWPEAQAWRAKLGLGPKDLHITLGIRGSDPHDVPKGRETLIGGAS
jgi:hypothetical protein